MAFDKLLIWNMAVGKVGGAAGDQLIQNVDDTTQDAVIWCQYYYEMVRKVVLSNWAFRETLKYADLGAVLSGDDEPEKADWEYVFSLPDDCIWVPHQVSESDHTQWHDCDVRDNKFFTSTLSNEDGTSAYIEYVYDLLNEAKFSAGLAEAIATLLAHFLAVPLAQDRRRAAELRLEYDLALARARRTNQMGAYVQDQKGTDFIEDMVR